MKREESLRFHLTAALIVLVLPVLLIRTRSPAERLRTRAGATQEVLTDVAGALAIWERRTGRRIQWCSFSVRGTGLSVQYPIDGWNQGVWVDPEKGAVISPGPDGVFDGGEGDDLLAFYATLPARWREGRVSPCGIRAPYPLGDWRPDLAGKSWVR